MPSALLLSAQQRDEVLRLYDAGTLLEAVVYVRRVTGAGLAEADASIRAVLREAGRVGTEALGATSAEVLAVGPFRRELVPFLDYGADFYAATREGTKLMVRLVDVYRDDEKARALAACFGADPWDFNTHALDPWRADLDALRALFEDDELVRKVEGLRAAGFQFYFRTLSG